MLGKFALDAGEGRCMRVAQIVSRYGRNTFSNVVIA
jgi:hypothetical protein